MRRAAARPMLPPLLLLLLLLAAQHARASIFEFEEEEFTIATTLTYMRDSPMFARKDSPAWIGGLSDPYIAVRVSVEPLDADDGERLSADAPVLRIVHGWSTANLEATAELDLGCEDEPAYAFDAYEDKFVRTEAGAEPASLQAEVRFDVTATGFHMITVSNCADTELHMTIRFEYRNPYGFLNGWTFGILPTAGLLCLGYALLAVVYVFLCVRNRDHILGLQKAIVAVIVMGLVERFAVFMTYLEMNVSGAKACCPMRADITFASALAVFKRSSSAVLLLAVCLGFGVVRPRLDRATNLKMFSLGVVYTFASLVLDFQRIADISEHGRPQDPLYLTSLVVSICDVTILFWIYAAISSMLGELREGQQIAKLAMYQSLARALAIWALLWFLFTVLEVLVLQGAIQVPWRYWYLLLSFWDLFFLGILVQICVIWAPSPLTAQYAFSQQLPTSEDLDEFDQVGLEMQTPDTAADFVIGDDDDELEDRDSDDGIGLDDRIQVSNGNGNKKVALD